MSNVHKLQIRGGTNVPDSLDGAVDAQPYAPLVEMLERLTALARRGQLRGAAVVLLEQNGVLADTWSCAESGPSGMHLIAAGVGYLHQRLCVTANKAP